MYRGGKDVMDAGIMTAVRSAAELQVESVGVLTRELLDGFDAEHGEIGEGRRTRVAQCGEQETSSLLGGHASRQLPTSLQILTMQPFRSCT